MLLLSYGFLCNCIACEKNYPLVDLSLNNLNDFCKDARLQIELVETTESLVPMKTKVLKEMQDKCIKKLRSIRNVSRVEFDNRRDVVLLQELLKLLMLTHDGSKFTIRK